MAEINWNELLEDPIAIDGSPLQRVIGVGVGRSVRGITVELHSLEIRELGWYALLRSEFPPHLMVTFVLISPELKVGDDLGTRYSAMSLGTEGVWSPGPEYPARSRDRFVVVPAIPTKADRHSDRALWRSVDRPYGHTRGRGQFHVGAQVDRWALGVLGSGQLRSPVEIDRT
jgi:hypothetical protein